MLRDKELERDFREAVKAGRYIVWKGYGHGDCDACGRSATHAIAFCHHESDEYWIEDPASCQVIFVGSVCYKKFKEALGFDIQGSLFEQ